MVRILEMEKYATLNNVPIMQKDGIEFLIDYIIFARIDNQH